MKRSSLALAATLLTCLAVPTFAAPAGPPGGDRPAAVVRVDTVAVKPLVDTVPVIGRLVARRAGTIAARVSSVVTDFRVAVGDHVEAGQVLALLDPASFRLRLALADGQIAQAKAALQTRSEEGALARQELKRLEKLRPTAATSEALFEDAMSREAVARARLAEAQAALTAARTSRELAHLDLDYATVKASYAGVVTDRLTETGSYVQAGQPVVRMLGDRELEIEAEVPFQRLGGLDEATEVAFVLDDGSRHVATVRAVIPQENLLTRTRRARLTPAFTSTGTTLAAGQSVTLEIPTGPRRDVLSVHKDAVIKRGEENLVYVVADGVASPRKVRLGEAVADRFEVLGGLQPGDLAVIRGNERLRPNDPVRIDKRP